MQWHERICETKDDKLLMSLQVELFCILILRNVMTTYTGFIVIYSTFFMDGQTNLINSKGENHRFTNSTAPQISISTFDSILRHFVLDQDLQSVLTSNTSIATSLYYYGWVRWN